MDYNLLNEAIQDASPFDLFRLRILIDHLLDDPQTILRVRNQLRPGMVTSFFDPDKNCMVDVTITVVKRTHVLATELESGKRWNLPIYMLNLEQVVTEVAPTTTGVLDRNSLSVGDPVGFRGRDGTLIYGEVVKLNPKRAKIRTPDVIWNVYYRSLFPVIDGEQETRHRIIDMEPQQSLL
ncbi:MAG: hypothetical protein HON68_12270 [Gammaproteobacteria bacterium]|jgi:hypothetical protein|nr:hypothetical protein [Gammaproteobacteria bacterium]MBT3488373.1 hypothetical protein [Gammaproteobacteria bacterium]MBT3719436.1 hypothetical protein [Gammaproteobacteria bacterium]MBT3845593.1 hypothetical protein [Gammaproteobacteria bacterium]MBT3894123.1 hypothetical protein [Gammaproteobacteria bacterium]